jgi:hypothetical protein
VSERHCAFLAMDTTEGWSIDAELAVPPLEERGWRVTFVPWRTPDADWNRFDAVYIGTPWDYPDDVSRFLRVLAEIDRSRAVLVNDLALVQWNISKTYLSDLEGRGADIVPSRWFDHFEPRELESCFGAFAADRIVVKPVVSTNATDTCLLTREQARVSEPQLSETFNRRAFVVQPFVEAIQTEGEYSLFYFGNEYSHAILKAPRTGDFRVQEEHGARIVAVTPERELLDCANRIQDLVQPMPVYARCDLVRGVDGRFLLMELELIEPSMYLRMHPAAPDRFAAAFDTYVSSL